MLAAIYNTTVLVYSSCMSSTFHQVQNVLSLIRYDIAVLVCCCRMSIDECLKHALGLVADSSIKLACWTLLHCLQQPHALHLVCVFVMSRAWTAPNCSSGGELWLVRHCCIDPQQAYALHLVSHMEYLQHEVRLIAVLAVSCGFIYTVALIHNRRMHLESPEGCKEHEVCLDCRCWQ